MAISWDGLSRWWSKRRSPSLGRFSHGSTEHILVGSSAYSRDDPFVERAGDFYLCNENTLRGALAVTTPSSNMVRSSVFTVPPLFSSLLAPLSTCVSNIFIHLVHDDDTKHYRRIQQLTPPTAPLPVRTLQIVQSKTPTDDEPLFLYIAHQSVHSPNGPAPSGK